MNPNIYRLRRGLNAWELTFGGRTTVLKHETGLLYLAVLLYHPGAEPLHAVELRLRALHPQTAGQDGLVLERSGARDDLETVRALFQKQQELQAIVDDPNETEPVRLEAGRELEAILDYQKRSVRVTRDNTRRAAEAVRKAIYRLRRKLGEALDADGAPHRLLREFARHLGDHLIGPSTRAAHRWPGAGTGGGCRYVYQPPPGVVWT